MAEEFDGYRLVEREIERYLAAVARFEAELGADLADEKVQAHHEAEREAFIRLLDAEE